MFLNSCATNTHYKLYSRDIGPTILQHQIKTELLCVVVEVVSFQVVVQF
jgi:hypothetical protein